MLILSRAGLGLLACLIVVAPASAAGPGMGDLEASLSWRLGFGGSSLQPGLGLALGYGAGGLAAPHSRLLTVDLDSDHALASLAGLPLVARSYRADEAGDAATSTANAATPVQKPWYTHGWVLWTVGGLAATAALAGGGGSVHTGSDENNQQTGPNCVEVGGNVNAGDTQVPAKQCANPDGQPVACTNGLCAFCGNNVLSNCPDGWAERIVGASLLGLIERNDWLDAGTGGMGDLAPIK